MTSLPSRRLMITALLMVALPTISAAQVTRTITFDAADPIGGLAEGSILGSQYAALGLTFLPNAFLGTGGPNGAWATNTDMTVVNSAGGNVGGLGTPSLVSGNVLHSFDGWLHENGDPSFQMLLTGSVDYVSMDFAGVANVFDVRMFVYDGGTLLSTLVAANASGQERLSFTALAGQNVTRIDVTPGSFNDWVGVDNITWRTAVSVVPEPSTYALLATGLIGIAGIARRRRQYRSAGLITPPIP